MQACLQWCPMATPWDIQAESLSATCVAAYVHIARTSGTSGSSGTSWTSWTSWTSGTSGTSIPSTWEGADCKVHFETRSFAVFHIFHRFKHPQTQVTQVLRKKKKRKAKISLTLKCSVRWDRGRTYTKLSINDKHERFGLSFFQTFRKLSRFLIYKFKKKHCFHSVILVSVPRKKRRRDRSSSSSPFPRPMQCLLNACLPSKKV